MGHRRAQPNASCCNGRPQIAFANFFPGNHHITTSSLVIMADSTNAAKNPVGPKKIAIPAPGRGAKSGAESSSPAGQPLQHSGPGEAGEGAGVPGEDAQDDAAAAAGRPAPAPTTLGGGGVEQADATFSLAQLTGGGAADLPGVDLAHKER